MITVTNQSVPAEKMRQFHKILCATGGRYISKPRRCGDTYRVDYVPGDYNRQNKAWRQVTTPIKESRVSFWRRYWNRFKI